MVNDYAYKTNVT